MNVFLIRDSDPLGGYFDICRVAPIMSEQKSTIIEVRKGTFPTKTLKALDRGGEIIPDPEYHYDDIIIPHWEKASVWWTREGGYVE